jgi:hypothetical protein
MKRTYGTIFGALLALAGCVSEGTSSSEVALVPEGALARTDLVLDETVAAHPLLASDARAQGIRAIPIEVEVFGEVAVAWERYDGAPVVRTREDMVALWRVVDRVPASQVTEPEQPTIVDVGVVDVGNELELGDYLELDLENRLQLPEEFDPQLWEALRAVHPICE